MVCYILVVYKYTSNALGVIRSSNDRYCVSQLSNANNAAVSAAIAFGLAYFIKTGLSLLNKYTYISVFLLR